MRATVECPTGEIDLLWRPFREGEKPVWAFENSMYGGLVRFLD